METCGYYLSPATPQIQGKFFCPQQWTFRDRYQPLNMFQSIQAVSSYLLLQSQSTLDEILFPVFSLTFLSSSSSFFLVIIPCSLSTSPLSLFSAQKRPQPIFLIPLFFSPNTSTAIAQIVSVSFFSASSSPPSPLLHLSLSSSYFPINHEKYFHDWIRSFQRRFHKLIHWVRVSYRSKLSIWFWANQAEFITWIFDLVITYA